MALEDDIPSSRETASGIEKLCLNMPVVIGICVVSFFCCPLLGLVIGGIGTATSKGAAAKKNAMIMLGVAVAALFLNGVLFGTGIVKFPVAQ